jgi:hypothetical protein
MKNIQILAEHSTLDPGVEIQAFIIKKNWNLTRTR